MDNPLPRIVMSIDGRNVRVTVEPRRCDAPSRWLRDPAAAIRHAYELSALRGWPVIDEGEVSHG